MFLDEKLRLMRPDLLFSPHDPKFDKQTGIVRSNKRDRATKIAES